MLFFLTLCWSRTLKRNVLWFPQKYLAAQLFSTLIIARNVIGAPNQHIRVMAAGNSAFVLEV